MVRISGPDAGTILRTVCPAVGDGLTPRRTSLVEVREPSSGEPVDRVLATWFPGPASYTGEDVVELSGHGGALAPRMVLQACLEAGARRAEPGEFTRRAYLNGKVDLVQAEAVLDIVEGRNPALHRAALRQLERGLSARIAELRARLVHLEALLVHHIDFPEEDDPPVSSDRIVQRAEEVGLALEELLRSAPEGELLREGALVVLAGRANSGKSSLFNALLGEERAIVTEVPGTTRDALEAMIPLRGYPFRVVDTAGLRESDERVERLGIEVARRYLDAADVVLFCAEAGREVGEDERAFLAGRSGPVMLLRTKADLGGGAGSGGYDAIPVSVRTGQGLGEIRSRLPEMVFGGLVAAPADAPLLTRSRQTRAVRRASSEVALFARALSDGVPAELAATHLGAAATALEEVVGVVPREEVLDHLFSEFCIGK